MSDSGELLARRIRAELGVLNDDSEPVDLLVRTVCARLAEVKAENSRLVVANKARDEFLRGHRHRGSAVDQYIDLCESHLAYWHRVADERNAEIVRLQARLARVMAVTRLFCAKYTPDLLAEFDAVVTDSAAHREDESHD